MEASETQIDDEFVVQTMQKFGMIDVEDVFAEGFKVVVGLALANANCFPLLNLSEGSGGHRFQNGRH